MRHPMVAKDLLNLEATALGSDIIRSPSCNWNVKFSTFSFPKAEFSARHISLGPCNTRLCWPLYFLWDGIWMFTLSLKIIPRAGVGYEVHQNSNSCNKATCFIPRNIDSSNASQPYFWSVSYLTSVAQQQPSRHKVSEPLNVFTDKQFNLN